MRSSLVSHGLHDPVQRVNAKHAEDLVIMARSLGGHPEATAARAERIDRFGIDLVLATPGGTVEARIDFIKPVSDPKWMRAAFKDLTKRARAALAADGNGSASS